MKTPIAIIGQGCILPGCQTPDELWRSVVQKKVHIGAVPEGHWGVAREVILQKLNGRPLGVDKSYHDYCGYVSGFEAIFNSASYQLPEQTLKQLDKIFQWSIYAADQALLSAGCARDVDCGVILGNLAYPTRHLTDWVSDHYLSSLLKDHKVSHHFYDRFMSSMPASLTAQALGLHGPCFTLDAACASGLYSIKLACDYLQNHQADLMLAGGVNATDMLFLHTGFTALQALSASGQSRPFHQHADGLIPAEGAAMVLLKRLPDAIRDGDTILGVIRGMGLSNDGKCKTLLTPSSDGQLRCMQQAQQQANIDMNDIHYIECHATGTDVGDKAEVASLQQLFSNISEPIVMSSLKANLGHLITAAGTAALVKVLQAMKHQQLPPTPNAFPLIPALHDSALTVLESAQPWKTTSGKRIAAVNAFGFGGNNAQLIVEDYIPQLEQPLRFEALAINKEPIAVIHIDLMTSTYANIQQVLEAVLNKNKQNEDKSQEVSLDVSKVKYPPNDLQASLSQQLIVLKLIEQAYETINSLSHESTGVFIGTMTDPEVGRYGLRQRLAELLKNNAHDPDWMKKAKDAIIQPLNAASVLGAMPNIPANRVNQQYNLQGMGFTISADELSGNYALQQAINQIRLGHLSSAIVAAVDWCDSDIHQQALQQAGYQQSVDKAAALLIIKPLSKAKQDGDKIISVIERDNTILASNNRITTLLQHIGIGHAHAASGLINIVLQQLLSSQDVQLNEDNDSVHPCVDLHSLESTCSQVGFPEFVTYAADDAEQLLANLQDKQQGEHGRQRVVLIVGDVIAQQRERHLESLRELAIEKLSQQSLQTGRTKCAKKGFIIYYPDSLTGELGFVYTGAAAAYQGMGADLLMSLPALKKPLPTLIQQPEKYVDWIYQENNERANKAFYQLAGCSYLSQIHSVFTRQLMQLQPQAVMGLSSGETNAMFAFGIWQDITGLLEDIHASGLYDQALGGDYLSIKQHLGLSSESPLTWKTWRVLAETEKVKALLASFNSVYLTIIYTDNDCVISGEASECEKIIEQLGKQYAIEIEHDIAVHCEAVKPFEDAWRASHTRATQAPDLSCRFYSNYFGGVYDINQANVAQALTGQALQTVDFPKIIQQAYADGVRIFIEHGPRASLSQSIHTILANEPHLVVALDSPDMPATMQAYLAMTELWCAGVACDLSLLPKNLANKTGRAMKFNLQKMPIEWPTQSQTIEEDASISVAVMPELEQTQNDTNALWLAQCEQATHLHQQYLQQQMAIQQQFLTLQTQAFQAFSPHFATNSEPEVGNSKEENNVLVKKQYPGPSFTREQLIVHASGNISDIFGEQFTPQDHYPVQCRMPEPPLLLADRVLGIDAEPATMGLGTIWTETDIRQDSWYLHQQRMPAGVMIEAGQADLMLISWLGIDLLVKGERAYRLLGCQLTYHRELPKVGETLHYKITITGHAQQGDVRLFFFNYEGYINDELVISVRNGQAGFFSRKELADSSGVLWEAEAANYAENSDLMRPGQHTQKTVFNEQDLTAYEQGNMVQCFGEALYLTQTHTRTPRSQHQDMNFIETIPVFDFQGGPAKRGYLKAQTNITPDDWYFKGHFKNDECMPGTLMAEACLQLMAFYMVGLGLTVKRDGWRFEPMLDEEFTFQCRGQVTPESKQVIYEIFVDEIVDGEQPILYAHVLATVDGLKAFLCERLALRLVPDWPLLAMDDVLTFAKQKDHNDSRPVASLDGFEFDYTSLLHCAWGKPSLAFGPRFKAYDGVIPPFRLPGPPYHLLNRIIAIDAEFGEPRNGANVTTEYDFIDTWYFDANSHATMPYSVLMEIALQPCGWLSTYSNMPKEPRYLHYRNLDGWATVHQEVTDASVPLRTHAELTSTSQFGDLVIQSFTVTIHQGENIVYELRTSFGFFTPEAMIGQTGLAVKDEELQRLQQPDNMNEKVDKVAKQPLLMLDRVVGCWQENDKFGPAYIRAEKDVEPSDWYFSAHFFQDPVQPGSLGVEAIVQLLQWYLLHIGCAKELQHPVLMPVAFGVENEWHYRGQVVPEDKLVTVDADIMNVERTEKGFTVHAVARLWIGTKKIYELPRMSVSVEDKFSS